MSGSNRSPISEDKMLAYIYDDVDDSDIFASEALNNSLTESDAKNEQVTGEANIKMTDIMVENEQLKVMIEKLREERATLELRISEVYKTAKAEIARKDNRLKELNEEKNNFLFRRNNQFINKQQNNNLEMDNVEHKKEVTNEGFSKFNTTYKIPKARPTENPVSHQMCTESKVLQDPVEEGAITQYNRSQQHASLVTNSTFKEYNKSNITKPISYDVNKDNGNIVHETSEPTNCSSQDKSQFRNISEDRRPSPSRETLTRRSRSLSKERLGSARNRGRSRVRQEETEGRKEFYRQKSNPRNNFEDSTKISRSLSNERLGSARNRGRSRVREENKVSNRNEFYRQKSKPRNEFEVRARRPPRTPSGSPRRTPSTSPSIDQVTKGISRIDGFTADNERKTISQQKDQGSNKKQYKEQLIIQLNRSELSSKKRDEDKRICSKSLTEPTDKQYQNKTTSPKYTEIGKEQFEKQYKSTTKDHCRKSQTFMDPGSSERKDICNSEKKMTEANRADSKSIHLEKKEIVNEQSKEIVASTRFQRRKSISSSKPEDFCKDINMLELETDMKSSNSKCLVQDEKHSTFEPVASKNQAQLGRNRRKSTSKCLKDTKKVYSDEQLSSKRVGVDQDSSNNEKSRSFKNYHKDIEHIEKPWTHREENYATNSRLRKFNFRDGPRDRDKKGCNPENNDIRYSKPIIKEQPRDTNYYNNRNSRRSRSRSRDRGRYTRNSEQDRFRKEYKDRFYNSRYNESKYSYVNRYRNSSVNDTRRFQKDEHHVTSRDITRLKQKIIRYSLERDPKALKDAMEKHNDEKKHRKANDTDYSDVDDLVLRLSEASEEISSLEDVKERQDKQIYYDESDDDFQLVKDLGPGVLTMSDGELEKLLQFKLKELHASYLTSKDEELDELTDIEGGQLTETEEQEEAIESIKDNISHKIIELKDYEGNMCEIIEHSPKDIDEAKDTQNEIQHKKVHDNQFETAVESKLHKKAADKTIKMENDKAEESESQTVSKALQKLSNARDITVLSKESQSQSESNTLDKNKVKRKIGLDLYKQRKKEELDSAIGNARLTAENTTETPNENKLSGENEKTETHCDLVVNNKNTEQLPESKTLEKSKEKNYSLELRIEARKNTTSGEFIMENIEVDVRTSAEENDICTDKSENISSNIADHSLELSPVEQHMKANNTSEETYNIKNLTYAPQEEASEASKDRSSFIHDFSMSDDDDEAFQNDNHPINAVAEYGHKKESKINIIDITIVKQSVQDPTVCNQNLLEDALKGNANTVCNNHGSQETLESIEQIQEAVRNDNAKMESSVHSSTDSKLNTEELQKCLEEDATEKKLNSQVKNCIVNIENLHAKSTEKQTKSIKSELSRKQKEDMRTDSLSKAKLKKQSYEDQIMLLFGSISPSPCKLSVMSSRKTKSLKPQVEKVKRNIIATSGSDKMAPSSANINQPNRSFKKKNIRSKSVDEALLKNKPEFVEQELESQSKSFNAKDAKPENLQVCYSQFSNNPNYIPNPTGEIAFHSSNQYIRKKNDEYNEEKGIAVKTNDIKGNDKTNKTEKTKKLENEKKKKSKNACIKIKMFSNHNSKKRKGSDNSNDIKGAKKKKSHHSSMNLSSDDDIYSDLDIHSEDDSEDKIRIQQKHKEKSVSKKSIKNLKNNKTKGKNSAEEIIDSGKQLSSLELETINNLVEKESKKIAGDKAKKKKSTSSKKVSNSKCNETQHKAEDSEQPIIESETVLRRGIRVRKQVSFYQSTVEIGNSNQHLPNESIHKTKSPRRITPLKVGEVSSSKEEFIKNEGKSSMFSSKRKLNDSNDDGKSNKLRKISGSIETFETCNQSPLPHMEEMLKNDGGNPNKLPRINSSTETFEKCNQSPLPHMEEMLKNLERKSSDAHDISSMDSPEDDINHRTPPIMRQSENVPIAVEAHQSLFNESIHQINLDTKDVAMLGVFERGIFENMSVYLLDKSLPSLDSAGKLKANVCESPNTKHPKEGINQLDFSNFLNKNSTTSTPIKKTETIVAQTAPSEISPTPTSNILSNKTPLQVSNTASSSKSYLVSPLKRDRRKRIGIVMIDIT